MAGVRPKIAMETAEMASVLGFSGVGADVAIIPVAVARNLCAELVGAPRQASQKWLCL
ncbi:hypothetical protein [Azospirillum sp.]|uniref:hypothetical protein n=1 Tax=Azospirillum sp. TaxID=34012 RepID=UPI002634A426|nr:hypothetical protein [Azospirillum sp.]